VASRGQQTKVSQGDKNFAGDACNGSFSIPLPLARRLLKCQLSVVNVENGTYMIMTTQRSAAMTAIKEQTLNDRMLPDAKTLKDIERMRLRDGTLTPDMCKLLSVTEIVATLLNQ